MVAGFKTPLSALSRKKQIPDTIAIFAVKSFPYVHVITSLYKSASLSVSEFACLDVPQLLRNDEPQRPEILRDDFPWNWEGFRLKDIRICQTVSWKITCIQASHYTLAVNSILSSVNL